MKLWEKGKPVEQRIEAFTVGEDRNLDKHLAPFDVLGSLAHIQMLASIGLLEQEELSQLSEKLKQLYQEALAGQLLIEEGVEDIHSQVELLLTSSLGDMGKKIHSGRSRNDQVLVDTKMYLRSEVENIVELTSILFNTLIELSEKHKHILMPGYTHMQVAMPSSFGLWFGAYAESLIDDLRFFKTAFEIVNQNPLGSAAGYGSSFPLDRQLTTSLLGFESLNVNSVYAQMTRGKSEKSVATAISYLAATVGKMSMDICLYMGQNYGFFTFPDSLTTGSSIMPHKKNPDVFELIRARCNALQSLPIELSYIQSNLPTGYHRDLQLLKETLLPGIFHMKEVLDITNYMLQHVEVNHNLIQEPRYDYLFTVEKVNALVLQGVPFRDAYKQVGLAIEEGSYVPDRTVKHDHIGSIGNPGNEIIKEKMQSLLGQFPFEEVKQKLSALIH